MPGEADLQRAVRAPHSPKQGMKRLRLATAAFVDARPDFL